MKLLFYRWNGVTEEDAAEAFAALGVETVPVLHRLEDYEQDGALLEKLERLCAEEGCDGIFSFNYFPVLSSFCQGKGIRYLSWVYDSPHFTLYSQTLQNPCNAVFLFDAQTCRELRAEGTKTVFYLPLGVNVARLRRQNAALPDGFLHDVSFVGSLYQNEYNFYDQIAYMPTYLRGYLDGCMECQMKLYGCDLLPDLLDETLWQEIFSCVRLELSGQYQSRKREMFLNMLRRKMTVTERGRFLEAFSRRFSTALYTAGETPHLPLVLNCGYAPYRTKMPEVFFRSRINLNITLRSILTGIPLRVLDILGSGGFCLTNFQPELEAYLENGKELVWYGSLEEALEQAAFYLAHEEARSRIARAGQEAALQRFSLPVQLEKLLRVAFA